MNLVITPPAQKLIAEQGNTISVKIDKKVSFGWGGPRVRAIPSVRRGTPETHEADEFQPMTSGGATVYVHSSLAEFPGLQIDADSGFFGQKLVLKGLPAEKGCCS